MCIDCTLYWHFCGNVGYWNTYICNDIRESMITALYNGILFSVFRDLDSKNQRCTKCDQYERTLAKIKKENQELQDRY